MTFTKAYLVAWVLRTRESGNEPQVETALAAECWIEEVHQSVSLSSHLSSKAGGCHCQSSLQDLRAVSCPPPVRGWVGSLFIDKQLFTHLPSPPITPVPPQLGTGAPHICLPPCIPGV